MLMFNKNIDYQRKVITRNCKSYYIGSSAMKWKSRFHNNFHSFQHRMKDNSTNLNKYI